ncbi:MAG: phospho-sugar mutase [Oscillospiraceae bacterium]|jgi:phosphoglucomutase|nr:phospho-sugar mutase [Oscillospiraceae bacterium]
MGHLETYYEWLNSPALSDAERDELLSIEGDEKEIENRFYGPLDFGTAGLRGIMAVGTNRMNVHVIRHVTQSFADVILREHAGASRPRVAICRDTRRNSPEFAQTAARVMAANGIGVLIFDSDRPTPELSFAIREYDCSAGVNITASHNTREYNGYKVYWSDGAQLPPRHAAAIAERMAVNDMFKSVKSIAWNEAIAGGLIDKMGTETDTLFLDNVMGQKCGFTPRADFTLVYTPFHGAGRRLVPDALRRLGVKNIICVREQMIPDGDFPTAASPNPENPESFALAEVLAREHKADVVIGTDPDCDRVAALAPDRDGNYAPITGNQMGVLLLDYIVSARTSAGKMPKHPAVLKSVVSTDMARVVAMSGGVRCYDTFTGFKFLAGKMKELESSRKAKVIFAFEEAIGYMAGDFVRDKDGVTASMLIAEMAAWYRSRGMTLHDALDALYERYGHYAEKTVGIVMPGVDGLRDMARLMARLRADPPGEIAGARVTARRDYKKGVETDTATGETSRLELRGSNMLRFIMEDGAHIVVRPSGTEPKIKVYILAKAGDSASCEEMIGRYARWAETISSFEEQKP